MSSNPNNKPLEIDSNHLLLVEGQDEVNFFKKLLYDLNIHTVQIIDVGGCEQFQGKFSNLSKIDGFDKVRIFGFIRDAEQNEAGSAFKSICGILRNHNLPCPSHLGIIEQGPPRVGIYIMPNNKDPGMLEDICLESIKEKPVNDCINAYVKCFKPSHITYTRTRKQQFNESKARVLSYLATIVPIESSLGVVAQQGHWGLDHPCMNNIKTFLTELFS